MAEPLVVRTIDDAPAGRFLIAQRPATTPVKEGQVAVAALVIGAPQQHGVIRHKPRTLANVHGLLSSAHIDLIPCLREALHRWHAQLSDAGDRREFLKANLILIVLLPKTRHKNAQPEDGDVWAFMTQADILHVGADVGAWDLHDGKVGRLIQPPPDKVGQDTSVEVLNPVLTLSREAAARLNGFDDPTSTRIVAVGAGALGSQVVDNLARSGFGTWAVIDNDRLLPHNVARHALAAVDVGRQKARAVCAAANSLTDSDPTFEAIDADVMRPGADATRLAEHLSEADLLLDMAASVSVSRFLARDVLSPARRASVFMNVSGRDLVMFVEDVARAIPLDALEMQFYRAIAADANLSGHFEPTGDRIRYGQSCRDVAGRVPQTRVSLNAAIAAHEVRRCTTEPKASITVWRTGHDMSVKRVDVLPAPVIEQRFGEWTLVTDQVLLQQLESLRQSRLPNETGGVLLGSFDLQRRVVYVLQMIASPPDSTEWPMLYIRGCRGLKHRVVATARQTDGMLQYVGEWHSHPDRCSTCPSGDDMKVFTWLTEIMDVDGLPAIMMIVGQHGTSCFIGKMQRVESVLSTGPRQ